MKKLPSINKFSLNTKINNNQVMFDSLKDNIPNLKEENKKKKDINIIEKINKLVNDNKYIFNKKVKLVFYDHEELCEIAGVVNNHIITMDNKIISLDELNDINVI